MNEPSTENQIILSDEQQAAVGLTQSWFEAYQDDTTGEVPQLFQFTGYAGTGKTTTINACVDLLGVKPLYAAYTGKAALVMKKVNGVDATTIHSLIYEYIQPDKEACESLYNDIHADPPVGSPEEIRQWSNELAEMSSPHFARNANSKLNGAELLILDECSMVNGELRDDLLSFGVPILAIGDPGQLDPVKGAGAIFEGKPDVKLEQIHRQANDSEIITMVTQARTGRPWPVQPVEDIRLSDEFFCVSNTMLGPKQRKSIFLNGDIILTGKNVTRQRINSDMREWLGFDTRDRYPQVGETLCCWKNDKDKGLLNGLMCKVVGRGEIYEDYIVLQIRTELMPEDSEPLEVRALLAYFDAYYEPDAMKRVKGWQRKANQEFDFGYCLTVHKAQGSQWDNVVFYDDGLLRGWAAKAAERKKLVYTAGTRAAKCLHCISA